MAKKHDLDRELRDFDMRQHHERVEFMSAQISEALRAPARTGSQEKRGFDLASLLSEASKQQAGKAHIPNGFAEPTHYIAKPAVVSSILGLDAPFLPDMLDEAIDNFGYNPFAAPGGKTLRVRDAIAHCSRVAQAGARLLVKQIETQANAAGPTSDVVMYPRPVSFSTIEAAQFSVMLDDAPGGLGNGLDGTVDEELPTLTSMPMSTAIWNFGSASAAPTVGVQIQLPRSLQTSFGRERLGAAVMTSVVLGLARALDKQFLAALAASVPTAQTFSLANAATQGLKFDELRGLIGTAGTGATIDAMGKLRVDGIPAELTADVAASYIGSFERAAIALHEDIPLHIERRDVAGNLVVTAYATLQPLIPDASKFWVAV